MFPACRSIRMMHQIFGRESRTERPPAVSAQLTKYRCMAECCISCYDNKGIAEDITLRFSAVFLNKERTTQFRMGPRTLPFSPGVSVAFVVQQHVVVRNDINTRAHSWEYMLVSVFAHQCSALTSIHSIADHICASLPHCTTSFTTHNKSYTHVYTSCSQVLHRPSCRPGSLLRAGSELDTTSFRHSV